MSTWTTVQHVHLVAINLLERKKHCELPCMEHWLRHVSNTPTYKKITFQLIQVQLK